jgi:(S)-ureidoglycine aminohydrolase
MKIALLVLSVFIASSLKGQLASLSSGVYNLDSIKAQKTEKDVRPRVQGSTRDLAAFSFHTSTLEPGKVNHPPRALNDREELIIVKDGELKIRINDSVKVLAPGSIALIVAGDEQTFENASVKPTTYYVLGFTSRSPVNIIRAKSGGGSLMKDWKELPVKKTNKGESRQVLDRPTSMFERFEVHATTLNAGEESHPPHTHREEEIMLLMKGTTTANISGINHNATAGDVILINSDVLHNLTNTGNEQCWYYAIKWYNGAAD